MAGIEVVLGYRDKNEAIEAFKSFEKAFGVIGVDVEDERVILTYSDDETGKMLASGIAHVASDRGIRVIIPEKTEENQVTQ